MPLRQRHAFDVAKIIGCYLSAGFVGVAVSVFAMLSPARSEDAPSLCRLAEDSLVKASALRGLKVRTTVPCVVQDREMVRQFILSELDSKIPPDRLRGEEISYKALGMIPENFDYKSGIIDMYVSQIGGYYNPSRAHYVMAGWIPAALQAPVAVHELTHALQDQYYDLESFVEPKRYTSDELLARSALVEGDATAVMIDYSRELQHQPPIAKITDVNAIILSNVLGSGLTAGFSSVPASLQLQILFPYSSGLRFVHTMIQSGGYASLDKVYRSPPRSSEEILHPEKYGTAIPDFANPDWKGIRSLLQDTTPIHHDTMGEFGVSSLMTMFESDRTKAADIGSGWGGDTVLVFERSGGAEHETVWVTHWDTPTDASDFAQMYRAGLEKRFGAQGKALVVQQDSVVTTRVVTKPQ